MSKSPRIVALLPMKAHSERVKSKNFRELAGKPLYRWIMDTLLSLPEISQVVINTDAREILADSGLQEGDAGGRILIRDRKPEICGDFVSMNLVLADDVANVEADIYAMTHTTNPLLGALTIRSAIEAFHTASDADTADSLFTVSPVQTRFYREDGSPVNHNPDNLIRTQDLEKWFEENSNLYLFTRESFATTNARIGKSPMMFPTPMLESVDIDGQEEWSLAEALALYQAKTVS